MLFSGVIIMAESSIFVLWENLFSGEFNNMNDSLNNFFTKFPDEDIVIINDNPLVEGRFFIGYKQDVSIIDNKIVGEYLGEIKRSGLQNNWRVWDATKLKVGTKIYKHAEILLIIAVQDEEYITYGLLNNNVE